MSGMSGKGRTQAHINLNHEEYFKEFPELSKSKETKNQWRWVHGICDWLMCTPNEISQKYH